MAPNRAIHKTSIFKTDSAHKKPKPKAFLKRIWRRARNTMTKSETFKKKSSVLSKKARVFLSNVSSPDINSLKNVSCID
tara:strand:- start:84 stop:320 length:237 start_codon:yes stop_codon:yes gene_type:complete